MICSDNYSLFSQESRNFWQKAHRAFLKGKMYFKHNGQTNIVPFRLVDGSFDSVLTKEKLDARVEEMKLEREKKVSEGLEVRDSLAAVKEETNG